VCVLPVLIIIVIFSEAKDLLSPAPAKKLVPRSASIKLKKKRRASKGRIRARSTSPEGGTQLIQVGVDIHQRLCYTAALEARGTTPGPVNNEQLRRGGLDRA
jgi:hypothetical protein